jgi:2-C-methyl-D-erythritol 4-phosphate cytidylyltransferase
MTCWAIVPAAGVGSRFGGEVPKQYLELAGKTVAEHTLGLLLSTDVHLGVVSVDPADPCWASLAVAADPRIRTVVGGLERAASVGNALASLAAEAAADDWVLVHDVVRPCATLSDINRLMTALRDDAVGGILATPVRDTIKAISAIGDNHERRILRTLPRGQLWAAQTPQMFRYGPLCSALASANSAGILVTDEASAMEHLGLHPLIVEGRADNIKITVPEDLVIAEAILRSQALHHRSGG